MITNGAYFIFPVARNERKKENKNVMKTLKQLLFALAVVIGISMTASAQDRDGRKPPPKNNKPPIVVVEPKRPKEDKPKDNDKDNRGKKPQAMLLNEFKMSLF